MVKNLYYLYKFTAICEGGAKMDKVAIGSRLREARNIAKLTQEQLAEKVGIGTTYISDIEPIQLLSNNSFLNVFSTLFLNSFILYSIAICFVSIFSFL